jgi:NADPH-dependent 2,4-dienoyl-CoA reductase/sulfur reductase-like enzyme
MREFTRVLTGPQYAKKLVKTALAAEVDIRTSTTVVEVLSGGRLLVTGNHGAGKIEASRVIYATGVRETPRSARIISGDRPLGVINTGALQSMVYLNGHKPFERPVIVGSELVSFSAIQTCRHAGISPVAMIEETGKAIARWPSMMFAKITSVPLHYNTRLIAIKGRDRVEAVLVENAYGEEREIACDGVLLTGRFTPEASLSLCGHLRVDPGTGGPEVDQFGRCSDPSYFAAGNILRPVETAGWSWNEGRQTARIVARDLAGHLPQQDNTLQITVSGPLIKYAMPQKIALPNDETGMKNLQLRFLRRARGTLVLSDKNGIIWTRAMGVYPERRVLLPIKHLRSAKGSVEVHFEEKSQGN